MSERLTFIGARDITQGEHDTLVIFGQALKYSGIELVIAPRGQGNEAVIEGYREFGGLPVLKPGRVLNEKVDGLLVYSDAEQELLKALDGTMPSWRRHDPEPIIVIGPDELRDYVYAALAAIKIAEMNDGVINAPAPSGKKPDQATDQDEPGSQ